MITCPPIKEYNKILGMITSHILKEKEEKKVLFIVAYRLDLDHFLVVYAIKHTPTTFVRNLQYDHKRIVFEIADTIDKPKQHQQPTAASGTIELSTTIQNAN